MRNLLSALLFLLITLTQAQDAPHFRCLVDDFSPAAPDYIPSEEDLARMQATDQQLEAFTQAFAAEGEDAERGSYVIPVVFHIIHNYGPENITDAQIHDAMRILNEDFNKQNPDWPTVKPEFLGIVADVGVEFRLAKKDPQGNCTNGITRTVSHLTSQGNQAMKGLIQWPRNRYLNIWVSAYANSPGTSGYTYRPFAVADWAEADGIVILHNFTGSIGTSNVGNSRVLTHEVGHWINLMHTWGDSNDPLLPGNCNDDDQVADTPNTIGWVSCNLNGNTCGSLDNVENYMDYGFCYKMFTNGQKTRMIAALNSSVAQRNNLWQAANLQLTGVFDAETLCKAVFINTKPEICQGSTVTFTDQSYFGATGRSWQFPGGSPATSTSATQTVTYNTPGNYAVTLTATNASGNVSTTVPQLVKVMQTTGAPFVEGFESYATLDASPWSVFNPNGDNTWSINTAAAHSGTKSVRIQNAPTMNGRTDDLFSQPVNMAGAQQVTISFRYAYAQRNSSSNDRLRVYVSSNCGNTWTMRQQLTGNGSLNTAGAPVGGNFVPNAGQWGYSVVDNIPANFHVANFRVRFEFESNGGNNIYLDDININNQPVGFDEIVLGGGGLLVVPNPAVDQAQAWFITRAAGEASLELIDVLGRVVAVPHAGTLPAGEHRLEIPLASRSSGMYFLRLRAGGQEQVARLVIE
ncbi:MAG: T9SS type A sorting domain-containing protein [Flavobacteriales bacterium]|nr:T9SS type A sorting domain-containing protein [Flavobacteriales bacterium]